MGKSAPPPPDYKGAAEAQAKGSVDAVNAQTNANRPDIYTPYGNMRWDNNGGHWRAFVELSPEQQQALDSQQRIQAGRSGMAENLLGSAGADLSRPFDWGGLPQMSNGAAARQNAEDAIYGRATSRLDPTWNQRQQGLEADLANKGISGGEGATRARDEFGRQRNDAYQTAMREAIMGGGQEATRQQGLDLQARQQGISEGMQRQYGGMNALNAFLQGQQVGMPQMPSFNGAGLAQAPQYLNAANMGYQAELNHAGQQNAAMQGWMNGAGSMASLPFMF